MDYPRPEMSTELQPALAEPVGAEMALAVAKTRNSKTNNQTGVVMN
jgi:hypothetical protein